eukprot:1314915-Pleurochrysis_carterae.AAC.1
MRDRTRPVHHKHTRATAISERRSIHRATSRRRRKAKAPMLRARRRKGSGNIDVCIGWRTRGGRRCRRRWRQ